MTVIETQTIESSRFFFDADALRRVCETYELNFEGMYDMTRVEVDQHAPAEFYLFKDNGSSILAVAHLDTVGDHDERECHIVNTQGGTVVYSRALDDRLGAYVLAELLPKMGLTFDLLFTTGEEMGQSTAAFFDPADHHDRQYNWIIEFDRGGTDVVLYEYDDETTRQMVRETGAWVGDGSFSDISYMEHLGLKAFNWGVGYQDYHGPKAHVWLDDMFKMVDHFLDFHKTWHDIALPHTKRSRSDWWGGRYGGSYSSSLWDSERSSEKPTHDPNADPVCVEGEWDPEGCSGDVAHGEYGFLCDLHASWYTD